YGPGPKCHKLLMQPPDYRRLGQGQNGCGMLGRPWGRLCHEHYGDGHANSRSRSTGRVGPAADRRGTIAPPGRGSARSDIYGIRTTPPLGHEPSLIGTSTSTARCPVRRLAGGVAPLPEVICNHAHKKDRNSEQVAPPQPYRLGQQAEEPLQAHSLDDLRGDPLGACMAVECRTDGDHRAAEALDVGGIKEVLARCAEPEPVDVWSYGLHPFEEFLLLRLIERVERQGLHRDDLHTRESL